jgi:hypothetical protein
MKLLPFLSGLLASLPIVYGCSGWSEAAAIDDRGDLTIEYIEPTDDRFSDIYEILTRTRFYDDLLAEINATLAFPQDIPVIFNECGEENAYYDPEAVEITMCYELIQKYAEVLGEEAETEAEFEDEVIYAGFFTFMHELGHALVDQYQLPIVGREEDVVDSFAAIVLLEAGQEDAVVAGIDQFDLDAAEEAELDELAYWDEHSLSEQRFYNIACLVYGSDPDAYADWVDEDWLPEDRAERCPAEYDQASNSWSVLLEPYFR